MVSNQLSHANAAALIYRQERINASIHFLGLLFGLAAIPLLISSAQNIDSYSFLSVGIYGISFLMVFTFSTLYHSQPRNKTRRLFKKLDRISIYFLIAGTYTPLIRFYVFDHIGIVVLSVLWCLALIGILFEIFFPDRFDFASVLFYLFMGLSFMFLPGHFFASMPPKIVILIISGVILYVTGVIFYVSQRWEYNHAIWHLFVLTGSIFHYFAIWFTVQHF